MLILSKRKLNRLSWFNVLRIWILHVRLPWCRRKRLNQAGARSFVAMNHQSTGRFPSNHFHFQFRLNWTSLGALYNLKHHDPVQQKISWPLCAGTEELVAYVTGVLRNGCTGINVHQLFICMQCMRYGTCLTMTLQHCLTTLLAADQGECCMAISRSAWTGHETPKTLRLQGAIQQ